MVAKEDRSATKRPSDEELAEERAFAEAALALAGHKIADPELLRIIERDARGELNDEETVAAIRRHVEGS